MGVDYIKRLRVFLLSLCTILCLITVPVHTYAATIMYWSNYIGGLDQYRMDFTYPTGTVDYNMHFVNQTNGATYDRLFTNPTGILYMTCNGVYSYQFYNAAGEQIGSFDNVVTTQIVSPTCQSYPEDTGVNQLNLTQTDNGDNSNSLTWDQPPAGGKSEVWKDGVLKQISTTDPFYLGEDGSYTIINYDENGNIVGRSDAVVPNGSIPPGTGTTGSGESSNPTDPTDPEEGQNCSTAICACINELKTVMESIDLKTDGVITEIGKVVIATNEVKQSVDQVKSSVDAVRDSIEDFHDEFQTENNYPINDVNSYPSPNLDDDKPLMRDEVFTDDTIYFTDQGDAEEPPAFPTAPEPVTEWETGIGDGVVEQEDNMQQEEPEVTEEPMVTEPVPSSQPILQRDPESVTDETVYPLRWGSEQYQP